MENDGFQSDGNNQYQIKSNQTKSIYPSQPIDQPHPSQPIDQPYPTQPDGQPYPTQPGGQPYPTQPVDQPYQTQPGGQPYPSVPNYGQPQPGYGYPNAPPYNAVYQANGAAPPNQQQQHVVIVAGQPTPIFFGQGQTVVPMTGAIALSCFVLWLCGWVFGFIAYILAMVGSSSASAGDIAGAIRMRKASYGVSIAGIVVGIITIAVIAGMLGSAASRVTTSTTNCYYYSYGVRYSYC